jgi:hypothetical protein
MRDSIEWTHSPEMEVGMKQLFKWIGLILLAVVVGLMLVYGFTAVVRAQRGVMQITLDQAVESANRYLSDYDDPDLALSEVMEFESPRSRVQI